MLPAVGSSPRAGGVPPSKAVVSPTPARARFSIGAEVDALRFLRATPAPGSHPLLRLIALLQTGSLTQLYGKPFNLPESRDGPHFGSHAVGRIATPRSARAPEPTWWDAPSAPQPQPQYPQEAGGLGSAKQPLYTYQVEMPAMAYQASVLEERMLLAVSLFSLSGASPVSVSVSLCLCRDTAAGALTLRTTGAIACRRSSGGETSSSSRRCAQGGR